MEDKYKQIIDDNIDYLAINTVNLPVLSILLLDKEILTTPEYDSIISHGTNYGKSEQLFLTMLHKSMADIRCFLKCLESSGNQTVLGKLLLNDCIVELTDEKKFISFGIPNVTKHYIHRESEFTAIYNCLKQGYTDYLLNFVGITGLAGMGKSELVINFAHFFCEKIKGHCIWINAKSAHKVYVQLQNLATAIEIPLKYDVGISKNVETLTLDICKYLCQEKCLFIFDNLEYYNQIAIKTLFDYATRLPPFQLRPFVIITSRNKKIHRYLGVKATRIHLPVLSVESSVQLFKEGLNITDLTQNTEQLIRSVCQKLNCIPLALQQALAYMKNENQYESLESKIEGYMNRFDKDCTFLLKYFPGDFRDNNCASVYSSWSQIINAIMKTSESRVIAMTAKKTLNIISLLQPDTIIDLEFISYLVGYSTKNVDAFGLLNDYSIHQMQKCKGKIFISVHSLVQKVFQCKMKEENKMYSCLDKLLKIVNQMLDEDKLRLSSMVHVESLWLHACEMKPLVTKYSNFPQKLSKKKFPLVKFDETSNDIGSNISYLTQNVVNLDMLLTYLMQAGIFSKLDYELVKKQNWNDVVFACGLPVGAALGISKMNFESTLDRAYRFWCLLKTKDWNKNKSLVLQILRETGNGHCAERIEMSPKKQSEKKIFNSIFQHNYKVECFIGAGAYGTVYKCKTIRDPNQQVEERIVAVKLIEFKVKDTIEVVAQSKGLAMLTHSNISKICKSWVEFPPSLYEYSKVAPRSKNCEGVLFIETEFCELGTLRHWFQYDWRQREHAKILLWQITSGANYLHDKQIIHGDLKPENILLQNDASSNLVTAKICDFGISRKSSTVMSSTVVPTIWYLSPEVLKGENSTKKADVYAIGIIFYEMLILADNGNDDIVRRLHGMMLNEIPSYVFQFRPEYENLINAEEKSLIQSMLEELAENRPNACEIQQTLYRTYPSIETLTISTIADSSQIQATIISKEDDRASSNHPTDIRKLIVKEKPTSVAVRRSEKMAGEPNTWIRRSMAQLERLSYNPTLTNKLYSAEILQQREFEKIRTALTDSEKNLELWLTLEQKCHIAPDVFGKILDCLKQSDSMEAFNILNRCRAISKAYSDSKRLRTQTAIQSSTAQTITPVGTWKDQFFQENNIPVDDATLWAKCNSKGKDFEYKNQNTVVSIKCITGTIVIRHARDFKLNSLFQNISSSKLDNTPYHLEYATNQVKNEQFQNFLSYCSMLCTLNLELAKPTSISISLSKLANLKTLTVKNAILTADTPKDVCPNMESLVVGNCRLAKRNLALELPNIFPKLKSFQIENVKLGDRDKIIDKLSKWAE